MSRFRARAAAATFVAAGLAWTLHGRAQDARQALQITEIGNPAIEQPGLIFSESRVPWTPQARAARDSSASALRKGTSGRQYATGKVLVRFRDEVAVDERRAMARDASSTADLMPRRAYADFDVVRIDPSENAEAVAAALARRPQVLYAQAAYRMHPTFVPNDPRYGDQWNLRLVNMEKAWDIQPQAGSSITVAVIDTGMAYLTRTITANIPGFINGGVRYPPLGVRTIPYAAAPDLVGSNASRIVAPFDVISNGLNPPLDFEGHGTHVSGTVGQLTNDAIGVAGVAFNVKLMPVKALGGEWDVLFGLQPFVGGTDDDVATGIRYAADNGAQIINMSLGSSGPSNCASAPTQPGCSPAVESALRYAVCTGPKSSTCSGKGVFVAVAGGNEFEDFDPDFGSNPTSVLAEIANRIKGVVSVAAVDPNRNRAWYSSTGNYIELAAPGGSNRGFSGTSGFVFQETFDFNFTDTFDPTVVPPSRYGPPRFDVLAPIGYIGTSQATPHVSGIAAMLRQQGITDPAAIEDALEKLADPLGSAASDECPVGVTAPAGRTCSFGFGLVNARNALRGLGLAR
jgi:serine protease